LIITDGGGMGVSVADVCDEMGLEVNEPSDGLKNILAQKLPPFCAFVNPIDLTGSATDSDYVTALKQGMAEYDVAIVMALWGPPGLTDKLIQMLSDASRELNKPVIICSPGGEYTQKRNKMFADKGLPVFARPEDAARAAAILAKV
ncbi:MAG TPA: CoA-binding protein, partial [Deltaproteobacteria bacterium]|nr:CoA-binding protein [Deltaproteobacteria bacterium]